MDSNTYVVRFVAFVGLVSVAALAACTGQAPGAPGAISSPPPTVPAPVTSAPPSAQTPQRTPTPLTTAELRELLPSEAASAEREGAIATAKFFIKLRGDLYDGEGFDVWKELSTDNCTFCQDEFDEILSFVEAGGYRTGGDVHFEKNKTRFGTSTEYGLPVVVLVFRVDESTDYSGDGTSEDFNAQRVKVAIEMLRFGNIWRINRLEVKWAR